MKPRIAVICLVGVILCGCMTWTVMGGPYSKDSLNFEVTLPNDWKKFNPSTKTLLITRDGLRLQQMAITRIATDEDLPFTKKKLSEGMLPQEVADIVIDNFRSNPNIVAQTVIENVPAEIAGYPGFRVEMSFKTDTGLIVNGITYGFLHGDSYYELHYEAVRTHYFSKDEAEFEKVKDSFRLIDEAI